MSSFIKDSYQKYPSNPEITYKSEILVPCNFINLTYYNTWYYTW